MIEDVAAEKLNEFCQEPDVSVSIRLSILQLLERVSFFCKIRPLSRTPLSWSSSCDMYDVFVCYS